MFKHPHLKETSRTFLNNLLGFQKSRNDVNTTAAEHLPNNYMAQFPSRDPVRPEHMRQKGLDGQPVRDYATLSAVCSAALPPFTALMRRIGKGAGLDPDGYAMHKGQKLVLDAERGAFYRTITIGPVKSKKRCDEKVRNEYDGQYDRVVDGVRMSAVVDVEDQLHQFASFLHEHSASAALLDAPPPAGAVDLFVMVRHKARFIHLLFNGYRDSLFTIALAVQGCWVLCEVQLHLGAILSHKEHSHCELPAMRPRNTCAAQPPS